MPRAVVAVPRPSHWPDLPGHLRPHLKLSSPPGTWTRAPVRRPEAFNGRARGGREASARLRPVQADLLLSRSHCVYRCRGLQRGGPVLERRIV